MKVRFSATGIRIRISNSDLIKLIQEKTVEISTVFSPIDRMFIRLSTWLPNTIGYSLENNDLKIFIPETALSKLQAGETFNAAFDSEEIPHAQLIVEVDLPCKH